MNRTFVVAGMCFAVSVYGVGSCQAQWSQNNENGGGRKGQMSQEMLSEFDADSDGQLSESEHQAARTAMEARMLERFDADGDGVLSEDERPERGRRGQGQGGQDRGKQGGRGPGMSEETISQYDTDGDGKLSKTERTAFKADREAKMIEEFDANGDGVLSEDERPPRPEKRRPRGPFAQGDEEPSFDSLNMSGGYPNEIVLLDEDSPSAPGETNQDRRPSCEEVMAEFDADGDGELSETEREAMEAARDARELEEFDANGDGVLSDDERPVRPERSDRRGPFAQGDEEPSFDSLNMSGGYPNEIVLFDEDSPSAPSETDLDRRPSREEVMAEFDVDGDGELSESEMEAMEAARDARELVEFDANGDGVISDDERPQRPDRGRVNGVGGPDGNGPSREEMLAEFDADGDGELSESEREAMKAARDARELEEFDANGDGVLSDDERPERPDPALKNSRGAMRDAHRNLMEAMKSGDSSAIALAQQALRDARGEFGVITQTYFNQ